VNQNIKLNNISNISGISLPDSKDISLPAHSSAKSARNQQSVESSLTTNCGYESES